MRAPFGLAVPRLFTRPSRPSRPSDTTGGATRKTSSGTNNQRAGATLMALGTVALPVLAVLMTAPPVTAAPAAAGDSWRGSYFANATLAGTPALVRDDAAIDFDWGSGAPAPGLPVDNFSVRWTRDVA